MLTRKLLLGAALALTATHAMADNCQLKQFASLDVIVLDNDVLVPATLGGQAGNYFVLDLGAVVSGIGDAESDALHLKRSTVSSRLRINLNGKHIRETAIVPVQLGGAKGDIIMGVIPEYKYSDPRVAGVLGTDLLGRFDVDLDLAHSKVNLFSQDHCKGQVIYWTRNAAVAAVPMKFRGQETFVIPMQLDGKDIDATLTTAARPLLNGRIAHDVYGLDDGGVLNGDMPTHTFKTLSVDGLAITSPEFAIYRDNSGGCNGGYRMKDVPLRTEHDAEIEQCFGLPDLTIGLPELKHLHAFIAFKERMFYATAAGAN